MSGTDEPDQPRPAPERQRRPLRDRPRGASGEDPQESFVERLESYYGRAVDPDIRLQEPEEGAAPSAEGEPSRPSTASLGLVRKLAAQDRPETTYEIKGELARGGMGTILRVWDDDLRRNLAMKVLHSRQRFDEDSHTPSGDHEKLVRFLEEAQITGQLDHPGIVPVHDLGIDAEGRCYFTMRLVKGRELKDVLDDARHGRGEMTRTKALTLLLKVCETMAFAHAKGVVHRDLKPANIMVGRYGEVYVMDWGLARLVGARRGADRKRDSELRRDDPSTLSAVRSVRKDEQELDPESPIQTLDGDVVGTPSFMAPEQAQGKLDELGPHSDVYSLGCILYYMLTGKSPYVEKGERISPHTVLTRVLQGPPEPVAKLATDQPAELVAICEKAMERDRGRRYRDMEEVADDIQAYLEDRVVGAYEGGSLAEFKKWVVRNRGMAAALTGLMLLALASAIGFAFQKQKRVTALAALQEQTREAKEAAEASALEAQQNLELAKLREEESNQNYDLAEQKRRDAERSSYVANVTAADYSLRLEDVAEARSALGTANSRLREWEWDHLRLRANPALRTVGRSARGRTVDQVAFGSDGRTLYALSREGRVRFYDAERGDELTRPSIALPLVTATTYGALAPLRMAVDPAESRVFIVGSDSTVRVFDFVTGELRTKLPARDVVGHEARVGAIAISRDGRYVVTGADNGSLILWDLAGAILRRYPFHSGAVTDLAWSPDSTRFASASSDGSVRVWELAGGQEVADLVGHQGAVRAIVWDERGVELYSGGQDGQLNRWDVESGRLVASLAGHRGPVRAIDFDPTSGRVVTCGDDLSVRVWDVERGEATALVGHTDGVLDVLFARDGSLVVSSSEDGQIKLWDPRGDLATTDFEFHAAAVRAAAFSPDERLVASGDASGELVLWDALVGLPLRRLRGHTDAIVAVAFDSRGRTLYSASADGTVRRWSAETGALEGVFGHDASLLGLLVLPGDDRVLTSASDKVIRVFEADSQLLVRRFSAYRGTLDNLALHPDGELFAGTNSSYVVLARVDGEPLGREPIHRPGLTQDLAFTVEGDRLVGATLRGEVCLWQSDTGRVVACVSEPSSPIDAVAVHPEDERIATGSRAGTLRIRDAGTGEAILTIPWRGEELTTLTFSPDGSRLLGGTRSGLLRVWETGSSEVRRRRWLELSRLRQRVEPLLDRLFDEHFTVREVRLALQQDRSLDDQLRQTALLLANFRGDDPRQLTERTLAETLVPGDDPQVYAHALNRAEAAYGMPGGERSPSVLLALGAAQFRNGFEDEALVSLERARALSRAAGASQGAGIAPLSAPEDSIRLLFLAMAHELSGDGAEAERALEEARERINSHPDLAAYRSRLSEVLVEAETLIGSIG